MGRILSFLYGVISYILFLGSFLYAIGFVGNFGVPKGIDDGAAGSFWLSLAVNAGLLGLFAVQHSGMARQGFKEWWTQIIPKSIERSTYVLVTSLLLILLYWQWRPMPEAVWSVESGAGETVLWVIFGIGWGVVLVSTFLIDHFALFGLRQVYLNLKDRSYEPPSFQTPGLYKYIRHPLMLGFLIAFWATPTMTVGHLVFSVATTGYILVGIYFEEQALVQQFGETYEEYRQKTPMLIPGLKGGR